MKRRSTAMGWAGILAFLSVASTSAFGDEPMRYDGYRIVQIDVRSQQQLDSLEELGARILNCHPGVGPMDMLVSGEQFREVERRGLRPRVLQDDVQGMVDRQRQGAEQAGIAGADPFADFFLNYHPYDGAGGITWFLNELVTRYPTLATIVNVGTTLQGRTIWGVRIASGGGGNKPAVVYFGCEHAREWVACTHPAYVAKHLVENYGVDPDITDLVDNVEVYLIPVFNVDGYVYSWTNDRFWRKNRRNNGNGTFGVDLNRNWGEGWGGQGSSGTPSNETYRGTASFSEPETQRLRDFFISHPNVRAQLDIHSYSQLILWPYGYTIALSPDQDVYQEVGSAMKSQILGVHGFNYNIGPVYTAIYPAAGVSVDWTYAQRGILSFSYEARDTGVFGFTLPANQIIPNNEELLASTLHLTNSDWVRLPLRFEFPSGVPASILAGMDTVVAVGIVEQFDAVAAGTPALHYRYDPSGPFSTVPLQDLGGLNYEAVLPATHCFSTPQFSFSASGVSGGLVEKPPQSSSPAYYTAQVTSNVSPPCTPTLGDHNGDGLLDDLDFDPLLGCLSGAGSPYGPGCRVFDFDADGDVDCDDAGDFQNAWDGPGAPPVVATCLGPALNADGARYVGIALPPTPWGVALRVTSPDFPCLSRYVDFDPNPTLAAQGVGRLVDTPVYRTAAEWGNLHLSDADIVPGTIYEVRSEIDGGEPSSPIAVQTLIWGDVAPPFGVIDGLDIAFLVNCVRSAPGAPPVARCDLHPAVPDYGIDGLDISVAVDAFRLRPYPFPTPCTP